MSDSSSITAMSGDKGSKTLAVGNSNGYVIIFATDTDAEWKPAFNIGTKEEIPVTGLQTLVRSGMSSLFVAGLANGLVKLINSRTGQLLAELGAHSRGINALTCHPSQSQFLTCSDDTFLNVFNVTSSTEDSIDVNVTLSSKVNEF